MTMDIIKLKEQRDHLDAQYEALDDLTREQWKEIDKAEAREIECPELDELYNAYERNLRKLDKLENYIAILNDLIASIEETVNLFNELKEADTDFEPEEPEDEINFTDPAEAAYEAYIELQMMDYLGK